MTPKRKQRLMFVALIVIGIGAAVALALSAFQENLLYFYTPSQVANGEAPKGRAFRVGGLVEAGSVTRESDGLTVHFTVTDTAKSIPITYKGILPDLFREGQGIVAMGRLGVNDEFVADEVLAKHDENYMPPEVGDAIKKAGMHVKPGDKP
ncbi:MAG TPA: cytochrome c maturation protein CcmE [Gammaproteobacteria bacterium]|nr:cytochrome c maturation protein CcmE [Gammaproteobacteria bacterium]